MRRGISGVCRDCKERYPACHDYCEKYLDANDEWQEHRKQVKAIKADEYDIYKSECARKQRRSKYGR